MNQITFNNYLKDYLRMVSQKHTLSVHTLFKHSKKNVRIIDPLILYCVYNNKTDVLNKYTKEYMHLYERILNCNYDFSEFDDFYFEKIYDSYLHTINRVNYDKDIKAKIREQILALQKEKNVSNYHIYNSLNLNHGNINAFLKNNDTSKLSLETAKRIMYFVRDC